MEEIGHEAILLRSLALSLLFLLASEHSTREAARKLGITQPALSNYIKAGKVPAPEIVRIGRLRVHSWSEAGIERLRELLPKIRNGRKTRYKKKLSAAGTQLSAKTKTRKPQPGSSTVPHD